MYESCVLGTIAPSGTNKVGVIYAEGKKLTDYVRDEQVPIYTMAEICFIAPRHRNLIWEFPMNYEFDNIIHPDSDDLFYKEMAPFRWYSNIELRYKAGDFSLFFDSERNKTTGDPYDLIVPHITTTLMKVLSDVYRGQMEMKKVEQYKKIVVIAGRGEQWS